MSSKGKKGISLSVSTTTYFENVVENDDGLPAGLPRGLRLDLLQPLHLSLAEARDLTRQRQRR